MLTLKWIYVAKAMAMRLPDVMSYLARYTALLRTVCRQRLGPLDWTRFIGLAYGPNTTSSPHVDPARPRRIHPRRARCGLSLFEAVLVMMIAVPLTQQGVRLAQHYIREQAGVQESRLLTQVVTAASTLALREGLQAFIRDEVVVGNVQVMTLDDFAVQNETAWISSGTQRTALGRDIQVIFHARGSEELVVLARAFTPAGEDTRPYVPRGGIGIGLVGTIPENAPNMLRGPGLNYDLRVLQTQATSQLGVSIPVVGDQLAIAVLRMAQDVLPFLSRLKVVNHPEANRMETNLDMGEFDLVGVGELVAKKITVENSMEISELRGTLDVEGDIKAGGDLTIPGTLTSAEAEIDGQVSAADIIVSGSANVDTVKTNTLRSLNTVQAGAVIVEGDVSARTLTAGTLNATEITTRAATIGTLQAGDVISSRKLEAETVVVTEELFVNGRCTGCE